GPVGVVIPFEGEDEAVAIANDTRYGLAASLWHPKPTRAYELARRIRAGTVTINGGGRGARPSASLRRPKAGGGRPWVRGQREAGVRGGGTAVTATMQERPAPAGVTDDEFRDELRAWLAQHPPPALDVAVTDDDAAVLRDWQRTLHAGRWCAVHWPAAYGG